MITNPDRPINLECGKVQEWWVTTELTQHGAVCHPVVTRRDENGAAVAWKWVRES